MTSINTSHDKQHRSIYNRSTILLSLLLGGITGHLHGRYSGKEVLGKETQGIPQTQDQFGSSTAPTTKVEINNGSGSIPSSYVKSSRKLNDGWHIIEVFYGDTERHLKDSKKRNRNWYAQMRQDELVLGLFRNKPMGYFVDLAANDAISISNTLALEVNANWTGLCIEPNPFYWYSLAYYRKCHVVAAVVGQKRMDPIDFTYSGIYGGIVSKKFDNRFAESKKESKLQFTVPLAEVFGYHDVPKVIDYLSLDVEGAEEFVMQHFPFANYTFSILTVERPKHKFQILLNRTGYVLLQTLSKWGETIWAHKSVISQLDLSVFNSTD
jgi:hypothetical protein